PAAEKTLACRHAARTERLIRELRAARGTRPRLQPLGPVVRAGAEINPRVGFVARLLPALSHGLSSQSFIRLFPSLPRRWGESPPPRMLMLRAPVISSRVRPTTGGADTIPAPAPACRSSATCTAALSASTWS